MSINKIAARYAKSLLDLAVEQNKLEKIHSDIEGFVVAAQNRDFLLLMRSPIVNGTKKMNIFKALFEGKMDVATMAFFDITIKKSREALLPEIAQAFLQQYKALKGITTVKLTSATPLHQDSVDAIKSKVQAALNLSDKMDVETVINPDLIGGFVIEIGDKRYDASVSHQLSKLRKSFKSNEYIKSI